MKRIILTVFLPLAALMTSVTMVVSCDKKNNEQEPGKNTDAAAVTISEVTATAESISFTLTPQNAEKLAWQILESGAETPTAEEIVTLGTQADATAASTVVEDALTASTTYTIVAAAWNEGGYSEVATAEAVTLEQEEGDAPVVNIESFITSKTSLEFTFTQTGAEKVYYSVVAASNGAPRADQIVEEGNEADIAAGTVIVDGLTEATSYILAVTAVAGDLTAEVDWEEFATLYSFEMDWDIEGVVFTFVEASMAANTNAGEASSIVTADFMSDVGLTLTVSFYADLAEDKSIPTGTYTVSTDRTHGNIVPGEVYGSDISRNSGSFLNQDEAEYGALQSGTMTISDGQITFDFGFNTYYSFTGSFEGTLSVEQVSAIGSELTGDYTANFSSGTTLYFEVLNWTEDGYIKFNLDDQGADILYVEIKTTVAEIPLGTFDVATQCNTGVGSAGVLTGTGLVIRENGFQYGQVGYTVAPAASGTVTITDNGDGTHTLSFDMFDDLGHNFTGSHTGKLTPYWF